MTLIDTLTTLILLNFIGKGLAFKPYVPPKVELEEDFGGYKESISDTSDPRETKSETSGFIEPTSKKSGFIKAESKVSGFIVPKSKTSGFVGTQSKTSGSLESSSKTSGFVGTQSKPSSSLESNSKSTGFIAATSRESGFVGTQSKTSGSLESDSKTSGFVGTQSKSSGLKEPESQNAGGTKAISQASSPQEPKKEKETKSTFYSAKRPSSKGSKNPFKNINKNEETKSQVTSQTREKSTFYRARRPSSKNSGSKMPFKNINKNDVIMNKFDTDITLAYMKTSKGNKHKCMRSCKRKTTCIVAIFCPHTPQSSCKTGSPKCSGSCHMMRESAKSEPIPEDKITENCQYMLIHPTCRQVPKVENSKPASTLRFNGTEGVTYKFSCRPDFYSRGGNPVGTCSRSGVWKKPSLVCEKGKLTTTTTTTQATTTVDTFEGSNDIKQGDKNDEDEWKSDSSAKTKPEEEEWDPKSTAKKTSSTSSSSESLWDDLFGTGASSSSSSSSSSGGGVGDMMMFGW